MSVATLTLLLGGVSVHATVIERAEDAIARLFPGAQAVKADIFLSEDEQKAVGELLGTPIDQRLITVFRITAGDGRHLLAYLDAHRVRTLPETLMLCLDEDGVIQSVDVLAFREPTEYMPRRAWYDQFNGRRFDTELQLNRSIQGVSGATLTGRATVNATRKLLCIHRIIQDREKAP